MPATSARPASTVLFSATQKRMPKPFAVGLTVQRDRLPIGPSDADRAYWTEVSNQNANDYTTAESEHDLAELRTISAMAWHVAKMEEAALGLARVGERYAVCDCEDGPPCDECDGSGWNAGPSHGFADDVARAMTVNDRDELLSAVEANDRDDLCPICGEPSGPESVASGSCYLCDRTREADAMTRVAAEAEVAIPAGCYTLTELANIADDAERVARKKPSQMTLHQKSRAAAKAKRAAKGVA